jgi:hypothetical protein
MTDNIVVFKHYIKARLSLWLVDTHLTVILR